MLFEHSLREAVGLGLLGLEEAFVGLGAHLEFEGAAFHQLGVGEVAFVVTSQRLSGNFIVYFIYAERRNSQP